MKTIQASGLDDRAETPRPFEPSQQRPHTSAVETCCVRSAQSMSIIKCCFLAPLGLGVMLLGNRGWGSSSVFPRAPSLLTAQLQEIELHRPKCHYSNLYNNFFKWKKTMSMELSEAGRWRGAIPESTSLPLQGMLTPLFAPTMLPTPCAQRQRVWFFSL